MKTQDFVPFALLLMALAGSQQPNPDYGNWKILAKVGYEKGQDEYGEIYIPKFNKDIRALEGKEITLPGYIIPFEGLFSPDEVIVSALPVASCFFCGAGGPETVAKAYLRETVKYSSKLVEVTGRLELNDKDMNDLMFILKDARITVR